MNEQKTREYKKTINWLINQSYYFRYSMWLDSVFSLLEIMNIVFILLVFGTLLLM